MQLFIVGDVRLKRLAAHVQRFNFGRVDAVLAYSVHGPDRLNFLAGADLFQGSLLAHYSQNRPWHLKDSSDALERPNAASRFRRRLGPGDVQFFVGRGALIKVRAEVPVVGLILE